MSKKTPGWQQPAVALKPKKPTCSHLGLFGATLSMINHPVGHIWVCTCGEEYVVVNRADGAKVLRNRGK